jgi:hypothetical protein
MLSPFLRIYRNRLIFSGIFALLVTLGMYMGLTADTPKDIGVFWHRACTCPIDPEDARFLLLSFSGSMFIIALAFGIMSPARNINPRASRFFLTRPVPRIALQAYPLAITTAAIVLLPLLAWTLLITWLTVVHAPSLNHIIALLALAPAPSKADPQASMLAVLSSIHFARFYLGSILAALCIYIFYSAQRWFTISRNKWLRATAVFINLAVFLPWFLFRSRWLTSVVFFIPSKSSVMFVPSITYLALHAAFIAVAFWLIYNTLRKAEL